MKWYRIKVFQLVPQRRVEHTRYKQPVLSNTSSYTYSMDCWERQMEKFRTCLFIYLFIFNNFEAIARCRSTIWGKCEKNGYSKTYCVRISEDFYARETCNKSKRKWEEANGCGWRRRCRSDPRQLLATQAACITSFLAQRVRRAFNQPLSCVHGEGFVSDSQLYFKIGVSLLVLDSAHFVRCATLDSQL